MEKDFKIITDSAANLPNSLIDKYNIPIISLYYIMEGEEYLSYEKGVESDLKPVYDKMRQNVAIKTSCLSTEECAKAFEKEVKAGNDIIYIGFSSGLSASFSNAQAAAVDVMKKYPGSKIYAIDSLSASLGQGRLVTIACEMKENGSTCDEIVKWLDANRLKMCHLFSVENLTYLYRGGRVSKATHVFADTLNIKPIMHVDNKGHLVSIGKTFGRKLALTNLASRMAKEIVNPESQTIYISHGDCPDDVEFLIKKINEKVKVKEFVTNLVDLVIGAHSGPGTIALFFLGNNRGCPEEAPQPKATTSTAPTKR